MRQLVEAGGLPGVIAKVRDGKGTWSAAVGFADTDTQRKRSADEHFRAGSNSKMFIATVMLQLEAEGKLDLDDTVDSWLPGLVRGHGHDGTRITLRQLLNHSSGIFNMTDDEEFGRNTSGLDFPAHRYDTYRPAELVAIAMKHRPAFEPGQGWSYSNTNYVVAGMVIEKATGRSYAEEATRRILRPLKLRHTSFPGTRAQLPKPHPVAYTRLHEKAPDATIHDATEQNMTWLGAAGDLISTADDLNRFARALLRGKLLPPAQMKAMFDGLQVDPKDKSTTYGLGIQSSKLSCGVTVHGHTGRVNGSLSGTASTTDGEHQLTFSINGDWIPNPALYYNMFEAEFCGQGTSGGRAAS